MIDLYLKTDTEANMITLLKTANILDEEENILLDFSVDHIGLTSKFIGYDNEGEPILQSQPGWHTNLRGDFTPEQLVHLEPLSIIPNSPYRVWAS